MMTMPSSTAVEVPPSQQAAPIVNQSKPALTKAAARGDLESVKLIIEKASAVSQLEKNRIINQAPIWTEIFSVEEFGANVSGEGSNNNKIVQKTSQHWYDVTPVTMAAMRGHHDLLQYLLEEGADPTLKGCPKDAVLDDEDDPIVADQKDLHMNAFDVAKDLYRKTRCCRRSHDLLMMCKPYWRRCYYSSSNASKCKREVFTNTPQCELFQLKEAISRVPPIKQYPLKCDSYNDSLVDTMPTFAIIGQKRREMMGMTQYQPQQFQPQPVYDGGRLRRCFICNQAKSETSFSRNQKKKGPEAACISCVASANIQVAAEEKANKMLPLPQSQLIHENQAQNYPLYATLPQRHGDTSARDHQQFLDEGY